MTEHLIFGNKFTDCFLELFIFIRISRGIFSICRSSLGTTLGGFREAPHCQAPTKHVAHGRPCIVIYSICFQVSSQQMLEASESLNCKAAGVREEAAV
mmetsp:Transcript_74885/g.217368  ORF Transcript_74885/g.217368 Transcript_74885/m.217368 type:complete len:98 (-) Transcript_74885:852-1145(-)